MQSCCSCSCTRTLSRSLATPLARRPHRPAPLVLATRAHSTASKPPPRAEDLPKAEGGLYPGHVPINLFQRGLLTVGSAIMGLIDTSRHDMIAVLSETSAPLPSLRRLQSIMRSTPSGRAILRDRPRITEESIDVEKLKELPEGSFGRAYYEWLRRNKVTPDTRDPVRYIPDPELAYLMQRYRESHDFYHVLLGFGVSLPAELVVKWFELSNFGLPVAALSGIFGPLRMDPDERARLWRTYGPWALRAGGRAECLIGVYWEKEWETPIAELRERYGVERPPVGFKKFREESRRHKAEKEAATGEVMPEYAQAGTPGV
ncbi:hypothetical protein Rhopal_006370-T1 [Rhodotorula paludigena]|uniref:4-hydroxy-3-methoxy-5-polyprenylbenzoate decarboxylase n=1 Tax=Rhodotorula paludigena TaxID=86838 RepID=A0AAV5GXT2_9BASI|nr:hypothetical protein Rhopal_006370-T1 [Rhodotorula paludigena]